MVRGVTSDLQTRRITLIHKRLAAVQRNEPLNQRRPFDQIVTLINSPLLFCVSYSRDPGGFSAYDGELGFIRDLRPLPEYL